MLNGEGEVWEKEEDWRPEVWEFPIDSVHDPGQSPWSSLCPRSCGQRRRECFILTETVVLLKSGVA